MSKKSPSAVLLAVLREAGWVCQNVEHWNSFAHVRQDLFGGIDILAVHAEGHRIVGYQVTSYPNIGARLQKLRAEPRLNAWLMAGGELIVAGVKKKAYKKPQEIRFVPVKLEEMLS